MILSLPRKYATTCCLCKRLSGIQIPAPILKARDSMNDRLGVKFSFSLYNAKSQTFFDVRMEALLIGLTATNIALTM